MDSPTNKSSDSFMDNDDLYRALAESSQDIIFVIDRQGYVRYVNSIAATFFGALPEEIRGRHLRDLFSPDAYEMQSRALQHVFESGEPFCTEEDKSFAGRKIWLETRLIPIRSENNEINHVMGVTRDITNLKHSQEELRETTDRLDAILKASPSAIVTLDPAGIVTHWNKAAGQIFGWSSREVTGKPYPIVPEDRQEEHRALLERAMRGESFIGVEVRRKKKDGSPVDINISVAPLHNRLGEIYGIVAVINDITARRQAEEELRKSEQRFRTLVESSPNALLLIAPDGTITMLNRQAEIMFGYARNELMGLPVEILVPRRLRGRHPCYRAEFVAAPRQRPMGVGRDLLAVRKDGSEFAVEIGLTPIDMTEGPVTLATITDITERKRG